MEQSESRSHRRTYFRDRFVQHSLSTPPRLWRKSTLERIAELEQENSELQKHLLALLQDARNRGFHTELHSAERDVAPKRALVDSVTDANWVATSELLASIDSEQMEIVSDVLSGDVSSTVEMVRRSSLARAMEVVSLLARGGAVIVVGEQIVLTEFGRCVISAISSVCEQHGV